MSADDTHEISLVHLIWKPFGLELFEKFIASYKSFAAGCSHQLVIVCNGIKEAADAAPFRQYAQAQNIACTFLTHEKGYDLEVYRWVTGQLQTKYVIFLNSYSQILAENWLSKYYKGFEDSNTGAVSASGNFLSYSTAVFQKNKLLPEWGKGLLYNFKKYTLFLKAYFYWGRLFRSFPNPHIRTNAFMIERKMFLSICPITFSTKFQTYLFESGRKGLTESLLKKGKQVKIVDKNGNLYLPVDWTKSKTFWISRQENLLISDNQTRIYDNASTEEKQQMIKLAWGANE